MKKLGAILLALALVVGLTLPAAMVTASPAPAIVSLWHFDTGSGSTAYDSEGTNDGTLNGDPQWVDISGTMAGFGYALDFDGDGDYVSVPDHSSLDITGNITVEAWVNLSSYTSGKVYTVAGKWNDIGVNYRAYLLALSTKETGSPLPKFYISSNGTNFPSAVSSEALSTGTWYHLAGTFDGQVLKIYVDGVEKGSNDLGSSTSITTNNEPLLIGGDRAGGSGGNGYFNGLIDEVRIWNSDYPDFEVSAVPTSDYNGVTLEHEITATVDPVAPGVTVGLEVLNGSSPNEGTTDSDQTDASGQVTLSYADTGSSWTGSTETDTIRIWVDNNWDGDYEGVDFATTVTKNWVKLDTLTPDPAYNPVGTEHEVEATISSAVDGVTVWFEVTGANSASGSATTVGGVATFSYSGTHAGMDTIRAYFDTNGNDQYDTGEPTIDTVTKYWLEPFVTGGGNIKSGKKSAWTFGGNVGLLGDTSVTIAGQFQIVDHTVKKAEAWHCHNEFYSLVFSGGPTDSPPAHWDEATFVGKFTSNRGSPDLILWIKILDEQEPGKGFDTIDVDYGIWDGSTFTKTGDLFSGNPISGGNLQVHDLDD